MSLTKILENANKEKNIIKNLHEMHAELTEDLDEHSCYQFSLLLSSVITSKPNITELQSSIIKKIFEFLNLGDIRGEVFEKSRDISSGSLLEAISVIKKNDVEEVLLTDCLILLLSEGELTSESVSLMREFASLLDFDAIELSQITSKAKKALGLIENKHQFNLKDINPSDEVKVLTEDALSEGVDGGVWYLDEDLEVTFPWQANNATFIFKKGVVLSTDTNLYDNQGKRIHGKEKISGDMRITNCKLVNSSLIFHNNYDETVFIDRCEWQGDYLRKDLSTALTIINAELIVHNSKFFTSQARAIQGLPFKREYKFGVEKYEVHQCAIKVKNCDFQDCGHIDMRGGAIVVGDPLYDSYCTAEISGSKFTNCKGEAAGALYGSKLNDLIINDCEFNSCESPGSEKEDDDLLNRIAVYLYKAGVDYSYAEKGSSNINNCTFNNTSLRVNDYQTEEAWLIKDSKFQNSYIFLPRSATFSSEKGVVNCDFKDGRLITLR